MKKNIDVKRKTSTGTFYQAHVAVEFNGLGRGTIHVFVWYRVDK